jgi:hypothetical protein
MRCYKQHFGISINAALITLLSALAITTAGCEKQEQSSSYKLIDTGMWTSLPGGPIKWLDNERVLFPSNDKLAPSGGPARMTVWKPVTGQVEFFQPWRMDVCVEDGQVVYGVNDTTGKNVTYYRGPVENPQEYPSPRPNMYMRRNYGCGWEEKDIREERIKFPYRIKLRGQNYLEIFGENEFSIPDVRNEKVVYFEREDATPVTLPNYKNMPDTYSIKHIEWRNAYLISPNHYHPNRPPHLWWLERNGRVLEEPLPASLPFPMEGGIDFFPTPKGIFIHYSGGDPRKDSGGYLLKDGNLERIFSDSGRGVELSPDGCRVVFDHAQNFKDYLSKVKPHRTLKMIDFCNQGGRQ